MNGKTILLILMMTSILIGTLQLCILQVHALAGPRIYVYPHRIYFDTSNGTIGTRFNITIWIENVTETDVGLDGWQVELHYDGSMINVTEDENGIRGWPSATRGANKYNSSYVFYAATSCASAMFPPAYTNITIHECMILLADAIILPEGLVWKGAKGLLAIIEFELKVAPEGLYSILDITNEFTWIKPNDIQLKATFEDGHVVPEFSTLLLPAIFLSLTFVAVVLRKKFA